MAVASVNERASISICEIMLQPVTGTACRGNMAQSSGIETNGYQYQGNNVAFNSVCYQSMKPAKIKQYLPVNMSVSSSDNAIASMFS